VPLAPRDGYNLHYEVIGKAGAPPLLLVMGLGLSSSFWDRLPALLEPRFRVVFFDNRGTGGSGSPRGRWSISDFADDAAAVLAAAGYGESGASVFGISMGGMIAQELVLRHPALVRSLVLGCTFASWRRSRKPSIAERLTLLSAGLSGMRGEARLARLLVSPEFARDHLEDFRRWALQPGRAGRVAILKQLRAISRHTSYKRLGQITAPTLIVTGAVDRLVPPTNSAVLHAAIPGSRLAEIQGAGHVFPLEREEETVKLLQGHFLKEPIGQR
jgi:3-oxoadipate enol-lactonase